MLAQGSYWKNLDLADTDRFIDERLVVYGRFLRESHGFGTEYQTRLIAHLMQMIVLLSFTAEEIDFLRRLRSKIPIPNTPRNEGLYLRLEFQLTMLERHVDSYIEQVFHNALEQADKNMVTEYFTAKSYRWQ